MTNVKTFVFNPFQVNTYLVYDETNSCIIIDAACNNEMELNTLVDFIKQNKLIPKAFYNTHCHIDHLVGNSFIKDTFNIELGIHKAGVDFLPYAQSYADMLGFKLNKVIEPDFFVSDGEVIHFGNTELSVLYTPGHADGSICFYNKQQNWVITGDVLFRESIGRTDLPTGSFDILMSSIKEKLFTLPDITEVLPGHGLSTQIGYEKRHNPFL